MSIKFKSGITLEALSNASTDTDRFLVSDSGNIKYRTGTQLLSDIGGQAALVNPITGTGTINYISKFTGATALGNSGIFDTGTDIGIGTTTPLSRVQITGTATGDVLTLSSKVPFLGGYILTCNDIDDAPLFVVFGNVANSNYAVAMGDWQGGVKPSFQVTNDASYFLNTAVAINTLSPSQALHVAGNVRVTGAYYDSTNSPGTSGQVLSSTVTGTDWITLPTGNISGSGTTNYVAKFTGSTAIGNGIIFDNGTNVGINTTTPSTRLDVNGVITAFGGTSTDWNAKQAALVSGTNIKTVNGNSILGSGNLSTRGVHTLIPPSVGQSTSAAIDSSGTGNTPAVINRLYVIPYIPANTITCSSLYIFVTSALPGLLFRILIYSDNNGAPGTKIYESASLNCATTGIKTATTTQTFTAGTTYWIGTHASASGGQLSATNVAALLPINITGTTPNSTCYISPPFGSAPTTFGFATTYANFSNPFIGITI
jgi:hypothetical protein